MRVLYVASSQLMVRVRHVSHVAFVWESKSEFTVAKVVARHRAVVKPLEEEAPGEQTLVEALHHFLIGCCEDITFFFAALTDQSMATGA